MRFFGHLSFRTKLLLGISLIVLTTALSLAVPVSRIASRELLAESRKRGEVLAENLAMRAVDPLLTMDLLQLKVMVDEATAVNADVMYVFVLDDQGRVLVHSFQGGFPLDLLEVNQPEEERERGVVLLDIEGERVYDFLVPVSVAGSRQGSVRMGLSMRATESVVQTLVRTIVGLTAGALTVAILLGSWFAISVTRRIKNLQRHAERVVMGDLDQQSAPPAGRQCWEIKQCGRTDCPSFGDTRRRCWYVPDKQCCECNKGIQEGLEGNHAVCEVYAENHGDEIQELAETFDVMAVSLDRKISEIRSAQELMAQQQRLMRTILDVMPEFISLLDTRMIYQVANKAFAQYLGIPPDEISGKTDFDFFSEEVAEKRNLEGRDVLLTGRSVEMEWTLDKGGQQRWFRVISIPVLGEAGKVIGLLRTERDVTEMRRVQEQLIQAQKMESIGKLAGGVAHEINTPLGIILGYAQLLLEDVPGDSSMHKDLRVIEKQTQVCRKIVSDLLGFSRQTESSKREMCFNNSIMEVVTLVRHTYAMENVDILCEMDERMPIIYGDPEKLKQVWINLLNNARDAVGRNGLILVRTRLLRDDGIVRAWFADSGSGISAAHLGNVFDPFFSTKPVGSGTGLGLSVSFGIVEDHEGSIRVESPLPPEMAEFFAEKTAAPGPGAVFTVDIPLDMSPDTPPGGGGAQ